MSAGFQNLVDKMRPSPRRSPTPSTQPSSRSTRGTGDRRASSTDTASFASDGRGPSTKASYTASSRITASDPTHRATLSLLERERAKVRALEATVAQQRRTIQALGDRVDEQGRENGNNSLAARAMCRELEAQTRWLGELGERVVAQEKKGKEVVRRFGGA